MPKKVNRYELVHQIAKQARKMEAQDREDRSLSDQKDQPVKVVNTYEKKRKYVVEAHQDILEKLENQEEDASC